VFLEVTFFCDTSWRQCSATITDEKSVTVRNEKRTSQTCQGKTLCIYLILYVFCASVHMFWRYILATFHRWLAGYRHIYIYMCVCVCVCVCKKNKGKAVPLQAWSGPEGSRKLRFSDYMTMIQDGGKVVSLTHQPPLPSGNAPGTHFCWWLTWPQGHSAIRRNMSMKISNDTIWGSYQRPSDL